MGYGVFQLDILKWDQCKDLKNSKYRIPYDDSDLIDTADTNGSQRRLATLKKALETIELVSNLKFEKYDMNLDCSSDDPCSSGLENEWR